VTVIDRTEPAICLRRPDGELDVAGSPWLQRASEVDTGLLERAVGPVLDVGCGPGRHVVALAERGVTVLGLDVTPSALGAARARGAPVLERSVFDRVPGAGRWGSALLLDGNLGIGGDPVFLLGRIARLLRPGGTILVELAPPGTRAATRTVYLDLNGRAGPWFRWAHVAADELAALARTAALTIGDRWAGDDRWFAELVPPRS
jgi:SAM-dependent methyltransferase